MEGGYRGEREGEGTKGGKGGFGGGEGFKNTSFTRQRR